MLRYFGLESKDCYEVGEIYYDFDKSCETSILETFSDEKDAIKYIVQRYINQLLEDNNFSNTKCNYYYRKKNGDMYSEWESYDINKLQKYCKDCKENEKDEIKKYLYDYNVYRNKRI
jgi:hypothetical protein